MKIKYIFKIFNLNFGKIRFPYHFSLFILYDKKNLPHIII